MPCVALVGFFYLILRSDKAGQKQLPTQYLTFKKNDWTLLARIAWCRGIAHISKVGLNLFKKILSSTNF